MALYLTLPKQFYVNSAGQPYAAAKLYTYRATTTTNLAVYTTAALNVAHPDPVVADANGIFPAIYVDPNSGYDLKLVLKDSSDNVLWTEDNIPSAQGAFNSGTFYGNVTVSSTEPRVILSESDQGTDAKLWDVDASGAALKIRTRTDVDGTGKDVLAVTRGSGTAVASVVYGNATDNPTHSFKGAVDTTGALTFNGSKTQDSGSFSGTLTGCTTSPSATIYWNRSGGLVCLTLNTALTATSNATSLTITGLPAALWPNKGSWEQICSVRDNGTDTFGSVLVSNITGEIRFNTGAGGGLFTGSGTKGLAQGFTFTYALT
jgi:hypothetical protein